MALPVFSVWAHYDDDLIFGNPTIDGALAAGAPITTLFLTNADAGRDDEYIAGRETGIRLAYDRMAGRELDWRAETHVLDTGVSARTFAASDAPITLTTLDLPDGRPNGAGFASTGNQSLRQLLEGDLAEIRPAGDGIPLDAARLRATLAALLDAHRGELLLAHAPASAGPLARQDHSDHWSTGEFVRDAAADAGIPDTDISWRVGYPGATLPPTLTGATLDRKVDVFRAYAAHDPVVARDDVPATLALRGFGEWLRREYELVGGEPVAVGAQRGRASALRTK